MSRRNSFILGLLFVILVVEIIILSPKEVGVSTEQAAREALPIGKSADAFTENSGQIMNNVQSVEAKGNVKEWELWATKALRMKANQDWTIEHVKVKFYASNGVIYTVTGRQGHVAPNDKGIRDIQISGDVVTRSSNGYVFKSETALYDSISKHLSSPSEVKMSAPPDKNGGELTLTGKDLQADFSTNEIKVNQDVKTSKVLKDNKVAHIQSDRAVFSGRTKLAKFLGHVVLSLDTMTVTGPQAEFAYDSNGEHLDSILVGGGVKMSDTNRFATSRSVDVNFRDNRVVFQGAPKVTQNGDELTGDQIVFLNGGRQVQVMNVKAEIDPDKVEATKSLRPTAPNRSTSAPSSPPASSTKETN